LGLRREATNDLVAIAYNEYWSGVNVHYGSEFTRASNIAASLRHFSIVKFACENDPMTAKKGCLKAAESGDLDIIELTYPIWLASKKKCSLNKIAINAAKNGHIFILEWAHKIGHGDIDMSALTWIAFRCDNLDVLRWIISTGHVFEPDQYRNAIIFHQWSLLGWMRAEDPNWNTEFCREIAEEIEDDEILMWLDSKDVSW
jgi:hypothetical protein